MSVKFFESRAEMTGIGVANKDGRIQNGIFACFDYLSAFVMRSWRI